MYTDMENWAEIRRRVLADGLSGRAACREYKIHWKTLKKILDNTEPPGYRRTKPKRPSILDPLLPVVHQILEDDRKAPKKQRHTAHREDTEMTVVSRRSATRNSGTTGWNVVSISA